MSQALEKGTVLRGNDNRYTIIRALGQGSFGITYLAHTQVEGSLGTVDVEVAVKEFFMKDINSREGSSVTGGSSKDGLFDKYRQKFRREAQNLAKMKHPGIVRVIEAFDTNNTSYIAMQYLGGGSLDDLIARRGKLAEDEALRYARGIGEALEYMHSHKMLHLDLKPSNVMLNRQGDPVIIDFGLSKQYDESGNPESSTTVGGGTPGYAPIEQASYREGKGFPVTIDIYALGATLFKMLCGHRPPEVSDLFEEGFPYGDLEGVSEGTVAIVAKAMSLHKGDRYQTVGDFLAALGAPASAAADESTEITDEETDIEEKRVVSAPTTEPKEPTSPPTSIKKKGKWWVLFVVLIALMAAGAGVLLLGRDGEPKGEPDTTMVEPVTVDEEDDSIEIEAEPVTVDEEDDSIEIEAEPVEQEKQPKMKDIDKGWVDLGLPSGTLWKNTNEAGGFYTYDEAMNKFGSRLPTQTQWEELINKCTWTWTGNGYRVTGINGRSITLPAAGFRYCYGSMNNVGSCGNYWSSTPRDSDGAWGLGFNSGGVGVYYCNRCDGQSVRLVQD